LLLVAHLRRGERSRWPAEVDLRRAGRETTARSEPPPPGRLHTFGPDGKEIPPTGKSFEVEFCTVANWKDGEIVEEKLFYDLVGLMKQIGVM